MQKTTTTIIISLLVLITVGYFFETNVWRNPIEATSYISGIEFPASSKLLEDVGNSRQHYYKWEVSVDFIQNLPIPKNATPWEKFNYEAFGVLENWDDKLEYEATYYKTDFWSVAILRNKISLEVIVAGIYTN